MVRRQHPRFDIVLPCRARDARGPNRTLNISARGALLRHPCPDRTVTLDLELPKGEVVSTLAVPRHASPAGQGVEFVVMSRPDRDAWRRWLGDWLRDASGERRRSGRSRGHLVVWASAPAGMQGYPLRNISVHGMFLQTTEPLPIGAEVQAVLVDPTSPRGLELTGRVVWHRQDGPLEERGIGVAFDAPDDRLTTLIGS